MGLNHHPLDPLLVYNVYTCEYVCGVVAVGAAFNGVGAEVWDAVEQASSVNKSLVFGAGLVHGLLVARQMFGSRGLSQFYSLTSAHMEEALEWVRRMAGQPIASLIQVLTQVSVFTLSLSTHVNLLQHL